MMKRYTSLGTVIGVIVALGMLAVACYLLFMTPGKPDSLVKNSPGSMSASPSTASNDELSRTAESFASLYYAYDSAVSLDEYANNLSLFASPEMVAKATAAYSERWKGIAPGSVVAATAVETGRDVGEEVATITVTVGLAVTYNDNTVELGPRPVTVVLRKMGTWKVESLTEH